MLVRFRTRDGNFRYQAEETDDIQVLVKKLLPDIKTLDPSLLAFSNQPRGGENLVANLSGTLKSFGIKHGDLLFASYPASTAASSDEPTIANGIVPPSLSQPMATDGEVEPEAGPSREKPAKPWKHVVEDEVDLYWQKRDGQIVRPKDSRMCRHGQKSMCDYCMPLEPYDANYHKEHKIKHLSYYAYLKSILPPSSSTSTTDPKSATYIPPLTPPFYKVQTPCPSESHAPYPAGICTKCQPSAITLGSQKFRMVDHVEFSDQGMVKDFFDFWQQTRLQRFGFLIGRYEPYEQWPMAIKAVVEAIYEPPQEGSPDGIKIATPWEEEGRVAHLAGLCGLQIVGCIFTDLELDEEKTTENKTQKFVCKRHEESYYLSCLEIMFAARRQLEHMTPSKYSYTGKFSSRFVTCVLSGTKEGDTEVSAYQVSDQAMGLVEADIVKGTVDPSQLKIVEPSDTVYVPDVFYRYKNAYGLEVKESAKPCFPVEYLLVNVTHGVSANPNPLFTSSTPYAIENRPGFQDQNLDDLVQHRLTPVLKKENEEGLANWLSDFHLLAFLETSGMFDEREMKVLCEVAKETELQKRKEILQKLAGLSGWQTLLTIAQEATGPRFVPESQQTSQQQQPADYFDDFPVDEDIDMEPGSAQPQRSASANASGGSNANSENVQTIMGLAGVSAQEASTMLEAAGGNVELAVNLLLGQ